MKNNVKIGIIVVCLAALAAFLLIKQPWKSGGSVTPEARQLKQ